MMKLAPLVSPDIERLHRMWLYELSDYRALLPDCGPYAADEPSWGARAEAFASFFSEGAFGYLARSGSNDIGHVLCARRPMEWQATFALTAELWEVASLYVDHPYRRRGLARKMLAALEETVAATDTPTLLAGMLAGNLPARHLYEAAGFAPAWLTLARFGQSIPAAPVHADGPKGRILRHSADDIARLRPLWIELHHHHQSVGKLLGPFVADGQSWAVIEKIWRKSAEAGLLWVAWDEGLPVGLASAGIHHRSDMLQFSDTWSTAERIAETKFLIVSERMRGRGLGSDLMDVVEQELALRGIADHMIGAIYGNDRAISFYQSRGLKPVWIEYLKPARGPAA